MSTDLTFHRFKIARPLKLIRYQTHTVGRILRTSSIIVLVLCQLRVANCIFSNPQPQKLCAALSLSFHCQWPHFFHCECTCVHVQVPNCIIISFSCLCNYSIVLLSVKLFVHKFYKLVFAILQFSYSLNKIKQYIQVVISIFFCRVLCQFSACLIVDNFFFPGRGDPTLSVSCSDKLARWVACGLQVVVHLFFYGSVLSFMCFQTF